MTYEAFGCPANDSGLPAPLILCTLEVTEYFTLPLFS